MTNPATSHPFSAPELLKAMIREPGIHPVTMAAAVSNGRWKCYPHLSHLARKLYDVAAGKCPRLLVQMPPRHGKSVLISQYFPAWYLGTFPQRRVLLASYESDFASTWGRKARDILEEHGQRLFNVSVESRSSAANRWDIAGSEGGMVTAGARAAITGRGADLALIDDAVKDAEEASSETLREKTWDWYLSTFSTRLHKGGSIIVIGTRWHQDDLIGRLLEAQESGGDRWETVRLPAIAEEHESLDELERQPGDALCPDLVPLEMLENIRSRLGDYWWSTLYQGRPYPRGGGIFQPQNLKRITQAPGQMLRVRAWDLAASLHGKRTAGVLVGKDLDGKFYILDSIIGQWLPGMRDDVIRRTAASDGVGVAIKVEQEGGSGGVAQVHSLIRSLPGYRVQGIRVTGSKISRADPVASQVNIGEVSILEGSWNQSIIEELEAFPSGTYADQVDALSLAFGWLVSQRVATKPFASGFKARHTADDWRNDSDLFPGGTQTRGDWLKEFPE